MVTGFKFVYTQEYIQLVTILRFYRTALGR